MGLASEVCEFDGKQGQFSHTHLAPLFMADEEFFNSCWRRNIACWDARTSSVRFRVSESSSASKKDCFQDGGFP